MALKSKRWEGSNKWRKILRNSKAAAIGAVRKVGNSRRLPTRRPPHLDHVTSMVRVQMGPETVRGNEKGSAMGTWT